MKNKFSNQVNKKRPAVTGLKFCQRQKGKIEMDELKITFSATKNRDKLNIWLRNNGYATRIGHLLTGDQFNKTININSKIYPFVLNGNVNLPPQLLNVNNYKWIDIPYNNRRLATTRIYYLHFAKLTEIDGIDYLSLPVWEFGQKKALNFEAGEMLNYSDILKGVI